MKHSFLKEIRLTFGSGGFVCSFNEKELADFHQFLERGFDFNDPKKVKKGLQCVGKQRDAIWVLNKDVHVDRLGNQISLDDSPYAWQPIGGPCIEVLGRGSAIGEISLECDIQLPLDFSACIPSLLKAMQPVFKHNFIASK